MKVAVGRGSAYRKIIFSFLLVVALFSLVNGIIAFVFSKSYERQVYDDSQVMLSRIGEQMDEKIFQQTHALYADLTTNSTLYPEAINFLRGKPFDSLSYYRLYISLRAMLSRTPGIFSSVSLYNKQNNSIISSSDGVKWIETQRNGKYTDWVQTALQSNERDLWQYVEPQITATDSFPATITLYSTYPSNTSGLTCSGIIRIEINLDSLGDILQEYRTDQSTYYLIDKKGNKIVGNIGNTLNFPSLFNNEMDMVSSNKYVGVCELENKKNVVISQPYKQNYILVGVNSLNSFYEKTNFLRNRIYLITFGVLILGLLLARILSDRLYLPIRQIVEPAKKQYGAVIPAADSNDEYAYIKQLMESLFSKASSMEAVLEQNFMLIQNAFFQSLLQDSSLSNRTIQEKMEFLHLEFPYPLFCVVRLHIPTNLFQKMSMEQKELVLYGLLNGYSEYENNSILVRGVKTSVDTLTLIVNLAASAYQNRDIWLHEFAEICVQYSEIRPQICVSSCVSSIQKLHDANQETAELEPYFYFLTQFDYLIFERIPALQNKNDETIPTQILDDFANHLQQKEEEAALNDITTLVAYCKSGKFDARHCNQRILSLQFAFSRFVCSTKMDDNDPFYEKIHSDFLTCKNIDRFQEWFCALVSHYLQLISNNADGNYSAMMKEITEYINQHLIEPISLELLADTFLLSSSYLSRRFKEETGVNYTDFVNNAKLARAADQLINSSKHIDEIAEETGFNSSAYFIKKFRQKYGVTPKKYRLDAVFHQTND